MPKKNIVSNFEHNFNKHFIKCSGLNAEEKNSEENCKRGFAKIADQQGNEKKVLQFKICCKEDLPPASFYRKTWKLHYEWAPREFRRIEEEATLPVFSIETRVLLNFEPYKGFTPCPSFFEGEFSGKIKLRFHECRCKMKHCLLRNSFPTYHPITGVITSVVNQTCIKSMCTNMREEKCNTKNRKTTASPYPKHLRNFRQMVLWEEKDLITLEKDGNGIPVVTNQQLGRIVVCLNHFPHKVQIFFWKFGHLPKDAVLKSCPATKKHHLARKKFPNGFSGHQVSRQALLEEFMLPAPNPDITKRALYPTTEQHFVEEEVILDPPTSSYTVFTGPSISNQALTKIDEIVPIPKFCQLSDEDIQACIPTNITFQDSDNLYLSSDELFLPDHYTESGQIINPANLEIQSKRVDQLINPPMKLRSKFEIKDDQLIELVQLIQYGQKLSEFQIIAIVNRDEEMPLYVVSIWWVEHKELKVFFLKQKGDNVVREISFYQGLRRKILQKFNNRAQLEGFPQISKYSSVEMQSSRYGISLQAAGLAEFASDKKNKKKTPSAIVNKYKHNLKSAKVPLLEQKKKTLLLLTKLREIKQREKKKEKK